MSLINLYSGPGQIAMTVAGVVYAISSEGENGSLKLDVSNKLDSRATAVSGFSVETLGDQTCKITTVPMDSWAILPALFPTYLGITTGGLTTLGGQLIGQRPHDYAGGGLGLNAPTTLWTTDGRLYTVTRSAIVKHPGLKLGTGMPLYTGIEISGLWPLTAQLGGAPPLYAVTNDIGSPAASNFTGSTVPQNGLIDFINGHWTGILSAGAGFTAAMDAEDGWDISVDVKYSPLYAQKRTVAMKVDSVKIKCSARVIGPTHTQLSALIQAMTLGGQLTAAPNGVGTPTTLVLSGPQSKTITLNDVTVTLDNAGFEMGGTKMGTGTVTFVTKLDYSTGLTVPVMTFSA